MAPPTKHFRPPRPSPRASTTTPPRGGTAPPGLSSNPVRSYGLRPPSTLYQALSLPQTPPAPSSDPLRALSLPCHALGPLSISHADSSAADRPRGAVGPERTARATPPSLPAPRQQPHLPRAGPARRCLARHTRNRSAVDCSPQLAPRNSRADLGGRGRGRAGGAGPGRRPLRRCRPGDAGSCSLPDRRLLGKGVKWGVSPPAEHDGKRPALSLARGGRV